MAQKIINVGSDANSGGGDPLRNAMVKINENFTELYADITALEDGDITTDIKGSVFADDSTLLVDAVNGIIPGYVSLADLKTEVAASADFADFKTRIAAL
jgi:inosine/xanthosine triphosphate pyrophosphatase family protein